MATTAMLSDSCSSRSGEGKEYVVYVLHSDANASRTYVGCTNDPNQRIRRHNGEICGGARYTRIGRPWHYGFQVRGFGSDKRRALSFEWHLKRRSRRRYHPRGTTPRLRRERACDDLLALQRWAVMGLVVVRGEDDEWRGGSTPAPSPSSVDTDRDSALDPNPKPPTLSR